MGRMALDWLAPLQRHLPTAAQSTLLPVSLAMLIQTGLGLAGPGWSTAVRSGVAAEILAIYATYGGLLAEWCGRWTSCRGPLTTRAARRLS